MPFGHGPSKSFKYTNALLFFRERQGIFVIADRKTRAEEGVPLALVLQESILYGIVLHSENVQAIDFAVFSDG